MLTLLNIEKQKEYKMTSLSKMASILKRKIGHNIQPQKEITDPKPNSVVIIDVIDKRLITRVMSYFQNAIEHANHAPLDEVPRIDGLENNDSSVNYDLLWDKKYPMVPDKSVLNESKRNFTEWLTVRKRKNSDWGYFRCNYALPSTVKEGYFSLVRLSISETDRNSGIYTVNITVEGLKENWETTTQGKTVVYGNKYILEKSQLGNLLNDIDYIAGQIETTALTLKSRKEKAACHLSTVLFTLLTSTKRKY